MSTHTSKVLAASTLVTLLVSAPLWADDTEIFFGTGSGSNAGDPNILLVLDTSGSMQETITTTTSYVPTTDYSGNCDDGYIYFRNTSRTTLPSCNSDGTLSNSSYDRDRNRVATANFDCSPATTTTGALNTAGYYSVYAVRWTTVAQSSNSGSTYTNSYAWLADLYPLPDTDGTRRTLYTGTTITCESDNYSSDNNYPNGVNPTSATQWTTNTANSYWNQTTSRTEYVFYSANYLNWYANHRLATVRTRLDIVQSAAKSMLDSLSGVNVGLMRYDTNGDGGMVTNAVAAIDTNRDILKTEIDSWFAAGNTPLSETYSEAYRYYTGADVNFGDGSSECGVTDTGFDGCGSSNEIDSPSVAGSRAGGSSASRTYQSPIAYGCQKNYIVYLTDGLPTSDSSADGYIEGLNSASTGCYASQTDMWNAIGASNPGGISGGLCLKELSRHMYTADLNSTFSDQQNVTSYFIGFGSDVAGGASYEYLEDAALAGGGRAYGATDLDTLTENLNEVMRTIKNDSATFTSPSIAVNAFNKTQILEDLYISVFEPTLTRHWPGNIKKYKLRDGNIIGQNSSSVPNAIDPITGFFEQNAQSYWSDTIDGRSAKAGGAAHEIPAPANRNLYTYIGSNPSPGSLPDLSTTSSNAYKVHTDNTLINDTVLGIGGTGDPDRTTLLNWARGQDIHDVDDDNDTTDARNQMGDPIHAQPAVVIYGNSGSTQTDRLNDAVVYVSTNDGYLHAIDVSSGQELWAFIPEKLLGTLKDVFENDTTTEKIYSLDGNIRVLKYDVDGDGIVDTGPGNDRVFLYFSQGRGGDEYYALDVTDKDSPKFMWKLTSSDLGGLVQESWSTPALGRVRTGSTQNPQRFVLIFAAGFDSQHDDLQSYRSGGDTYGKGLFMVDAVRGTVLWSQGRTSNGSAFDGMTHAISSDVAVLDTNGDGWSDRMYVGDLAGQLWRFDITNYVDNPAPVTDTAFGVAGGVIASLGAKAESTPTTANNRRFYNAPDVAKFTVVGSANFYNIGIGSGDRSHPKSNTTTQDRFYSIRDYRLSPMTQVQYDSYTPMVESNLTTITGLTATTIGGNGWKMALGSGEKVLAQAVTVNGVSLFTTYRPDGATGACNPGAGSGRAYAVSILNGMKFFADPNTSVTTDGDGLYEDFATTGLPSQITIVNEDRIVRTDGSTSTSTGGTAGTCLSGVSIQNNCVNFGTRVKTFWQDSGAR